MKNDIIQRYPLQIKTGQQEIVLPEGAELLTVQIQERVPVLWALINPFNVKTTRVFEVHQTGDALLGITNNKTNYKYISSFQCEKTKTAHHIFEVLSEK